MAVISIACAAILAGGHSAFSAGLQPTDNLAEDFGPPPEPLKLSDIPVQLADTQDVVLTEDVPNLLLINIWATWCAPCVEEMPSLDALQAELGGEGFEVVAISMDRQGMEKVGPFFEKTGITALKPYTDISGKFSRDMGAMGLPVSYLVKDGEVIRHLVGPADWASEAAKEIIRAEM